MSDLTSVIEDAITDVELPDPDPTPAEPVEVAPEAAEPVLDPIPEEVVPEGEVVIPSPVAKAEAKTDDFDKKYGLAPQSVSGRENRIPYTRVKKIADNAAKEAVTSAKATWTKELEASHVPVVKYQELETETKTQKEQLAKVAEFEHVMLNDTPRFIRMLAGLPQYATILAPIINPQAQAKPAEAAPVATSDPSDPMPEPDFDQGDGGKVYSMEGLAKLNAWNRAQAKAEARKEVMAEVEKRFGPIEEDYKRYQHMQTIVPVIQQQITDARAWPLFTESEAEITKVLRDNPTFNLERAYQTVVLPKLKADRDTMRADILKEVKTAPRTTSTPATSVKATPVVKAGPRTLEDVIAEAIAGKG